MSLSSFSHNIIKKYNLPVEQQERTISSLEGGLSWRPKLQQRPGFNKYVNKNNNKTRKKNPATKNCLTDIQCVQLSHNTITIILTLKRSFAAAIKWFAFRYLNTVKESTIMWTLFTITERFLTH